MNVKVKIQVPSRTKLYRQKKQNRFIISIFPGVTRETNLNEHKNAVLLLECDSETEAVGLPEPLPLVKPGYTRFKLMQLLPFSGYERFFSNVPKYQ